MITANEFTYDVFLSHSAKDKAVVRPLAERLQEDGLKVWFDEWVLKPGDSIPAKIEEGQLWRCSPENWITRISKVRRAKSKPWCCPRCGKPTSAELGVCASLAVVSWRK